MVFSSVSGDSGCGEMLGQGLFHRHERRMNCPSPARTAGGFAWWGEVCVGVGGAEEGDSVVSLRCTRLFETENSGPHAARVTVDKSDLFQYEGS